MTTTASNDATPAQRREDALRRAAQAKHQAAVGRAEKAIRQLVKNKQEITFRTVARTGAVSLDFLYANTDLRRRIQALREQQTTRTPKPATEPPAADSDGNITHVLTGKLREERAARHAAVRDLEQRLSAAHGEILRLRRTLHQHGLDT